MNVLVLDVGTTSMRGILYDQAGSKLAVCQLPCHPHFADNGWVSEDPEDWSGNTINIMKSIAGQISAETTVDVIAITSQRSSITPVDRDGKPLMDTIMWQDKRNLDICKELAVHNEEVFAKTGSLVNAVFSGSKMTWVRRECPEIYEKVYKFVNIPEYINFVMTGEYVSDYTYASRSGLFNLKTRRFDQELLDLYEVEADKLCTLIEPGSLAGYTTEQFASMTGIRAGTPVIHAGGDQQCAAIGQGVTRSGNVSIVNGTGSFMIAALDEVPDNLRSNVICNCSSLPGKYVIEANVLACAAAYDWFARQIYGMEKIDYDHLDHELKQEAGVTSCVVLPYFQGRGAPDWNTSAKAAFMDVTLATRRSEMLKSMVESIFMELGNHLENFSAYVPLENIYISGGMTKNKLLNQLMADIFGKTLINDHDPETTARGAFLIGLVYLGLYADVEQAAERMGLFKNADTYEPDTALYEPYQEKRQRMNKLYQSIY